MKNLPFKGFIFKILRKFIIEGIPKIRFKMKSGFPKESQSKIK
jgi:hypothetical protein